MKELLDVSDRTMTADDWRKWLQFVFLGGGPCTVSDDELKRSVCARWDADVKTARDGSIGKTMTWVSDDFLMCRRCRMSALKWREAQATCPNCGATFAEQW